MLKKVSLAVLLLLGLPAVLGDRNGGKTCAGCTAVLGLVEQVAQINAGPITDAIKQVCGLLPSPYSWTCSTLISLYGKDLIKMLEDKYTPDVICTTINVCKQDTAPTCRLFPAPKSRRANDGSRMSQEEFELHVKEAKQRFDFSHVGDLNICDWMPGFCQVADHKPYFDTDGDVFSSYSGLRGHDWSGKDCDDSNNAVFPGRYDKDIAQDTNCNGIFGVDPRTGVSYEDQWCEGTGAMGVAILGDSAAAHFRIPPNYLVAQNLSTNTLSRLVWNAENELDFPQLSWSTGHQQTSTYGPDVDGPMNSIYMKMRQNNLCNHNDYQNIGVNGASSGSMARELQHLLGRDKNNSPLPQKPLLLFMAMIGNDVCNSHITSRTTPQEYHDNFLKTVTDLDPRMPKGTKVVMIGLVDGRILYDSMHDRVHPVGSTNNDVTYRDFYDYLNCLEISPCAGWMNSNQTVRDGLSATAAAMRDQLPLIVEETRGKLKNIEVYYLGDVLDEAIQEFLK